MSLGTENKTRPRVVGTASSVRDPVSLEPGQMVGEYRIKGELASGAMGKVYAAVHPIIGKKAAIKVISAKLSVDEAAPSTLPDPSSEP